MSIAGVLYDDCICRQYSSKYIGNIVSDSDTTDYIRLYIYYTVHSVSITKTIINYNVTYRNSPSVNIIRDKPDILIVLKVKYCNILYILFITIANGIVDVVEYIQYTDVPSIGGCDDNSPPRPPVSKNDFIPINPDDPDI